MNEYHPSLRYVGMLSKGLSVDLNQHRFIYFLNVFKALSKASINLHSIKLRQISENRIVLLSAEDSKINE